MLVYNQNDNNTGGGLFHITGNSEAYLQGTPAYTLDALGNAVPKRYAGILFFQDRTSADHSGPGVSNLHQIGGGGTMELQGTIYATNTVDTIANSGKYQKIVYNGGPCTNTFLIGMIITDALQLNGGGCINMTLESQAFLKLRQIALIGGGPHF